MGKRFGFPGNEKLKSRKAIEALYLSGKSFAHFPIRVHYRFVETEPSGKVLVGVAVSKRHFKRAVDRNRIKRLLREAYRLQKITITELMQLTPGQLHIFFTYTDKALPKFETVFTTVQQCLSRLIKQIEQQNAGTA